MIVALILMALLAVVVVSSTLEIAESKKLRDEQQNKEAQ